MGDTVIPNPPPTGSEGAASDGGGVLGTLISKLDISGPWFLHPSDTNGLTIVNIKLKGSENYSIWSSAMKLALDTKNKGGFIDGTCVRSTSDDTLCEQWDRCNFGGLSWLLNSVSEELYLRHVFSKYAYEAWIDLKETYDKADGSVRADNFVYEHDYLTRT